MKKRMFKLFYGMTTAALFTAGLIGCSGNFPSQPQMETKSTSSIHVLMKQDSTKIIAPSDTTKISFPGGSGLLQPNSRYGVGAE